MNANLYKEQPKDPFAVTVPRSAYIHIPFCRHRCGYCNFSLVANRDYLIDRFLNALQNEIESLPDRINLDTLFLGGGTPSHLSPGQLKRLKQMIGNRFDLVPDAEVTAECNPNDLDPARCHALADFGVNRISLGVQSMDTNKLIRLDRDHSAEDVAKAIDLSRGFARSISIDLIFAAPTETIDQWKQDLMSAIDIGPDHVSTYELTFEKGTQFWNQLRRGSLSQAEEELRAEMYEWVMHFLPQRGYGQYEISSFAKSGHVCRHNQVYWNGRPYLAFGPGASSFIDGVRQTNHSSTMRYLKLVEEGKSPLALTEKLPPQEAARELLAIGLRMVVGVNQQQFQHRTGFFVSDLLGSRFEDWQDNRILENWDGNIRLTPRGRLVYDQVAIEIFGRSIN